ncbi:MAG: ATP-dependent DNA ligase, partial [Chloroflexota bacterium]
LQAHRDGERVWLFTRRLEDVTGAFPEITRAVRGQVMAQQAILDGEAVGYDPRTGEFLPFQQTARRRRKHRVTELEATFPLRYYLFDLLYLDGQDLTGAPQRCRSERLDSIVQANPAGAIDVAPRLETEDPEELTVFVEEMLRRGLEGAVVKRPDAPYEAGARRFTWVKLKRGSGGTVLDTFDLVVLGYDRGRGKRASLGIGSLLGGVYDPERDRFQTASRVGSGLTDDEWLRLRATLDARATPVKPPRTDSLLVPDVWVEPTEVLEVVAGEIVRSPRHTCGMVDGQPGYALRFPRVSGFRPDRRPEDATTPAEVIALYRLQRTRVNGPRDPC